MAKLLRVLLVALALSMTTGTVTIAAPCDPGEFACP